MRPSDAAATGAPERAPSAARQHRAPRGSGRAARHPLSGRARMATSPAPPASGARAGALGLVDLLPQRVEIQHEPRAAPHAHAPAPRGAGNRVAAVAAQLVDLEAA